MLATFLFRMKNGASLKLVETVFGLQSFQLAARMINKARECLNNDLVQISL
jgi:hypothetical protein